MVLSCARQSCGDDAVASLQFDADGARVVLIDLTDRTAGMPVCRRHAATRTAPMGWTLDDRRSREQTRLWDETNPAVRVGSGGRNQVAMIHGAVASYAPPVEGPSVRPPRRRATDAPVDRLLPPAPTSAATAPEGPMLRRAFWSIS